jgi:hypothetical protein
MITHTFNVENNIQNNYFYTGRWKNGYKEGNGRQQLTFIEKNDVKDKPKVITIQEGNFIKNDIVEGNEFSYVIEKRKEILISKFKNNLELLDNQIKFINLVKQNTKIFNLDEKDIINFLTKNNIKKYDESYNYLINMSFKQLSQDNLNKLSIKVKEIKNKKNVLKSKTPKDLWLDDLIVLEKNIIV